MIDMLETPMTFQEVGDYFGCSRQSVHQQTGPIGRRRTWRRDVTEDKRNQVLQLASDELLPYAQISEITGVGVNTVSKIARQAGIHRKSGPVPHQTGDKILEAAVRWESRYSEWPKASHWKKSGAAANPEFFRRYMEFRPPEYKTVVKNFGSFNVMIEEAKKLKIRMKRRKQ